MRNLRLILIGLVLWACIPAVAEELSYIDLISRLTDMEQLATLPAPGEITAQCSSYDRASIYNDETGEYIDWSANADGEGIIGTEDDHSVIAQMKGPGVIWRIWTADAQQGHVKIYLDGAESPAVDLPFIGYFNHENEPFTRSELVYTSALGLNSYVPIPYQKSCKITAEKDWGRYYHFTYSTFPEGTIVPTFKRDLSPAEAAALDEANAKLTNRGTEPPARRLGQITAQKTVIIAPGKTEEIFKLSGPRAITALEVKMDLPEPPKDRDVLRELILSIYWDGQAEPAVWSPLGDFFGTAPGANKYKSLPMGITEDGFYSYWYMPFEKDARIKLTNNGDIKYEVTFTITFARLERPIAELGRFHAKWHRDALLPQEPQRRAIDWTILKTQGKGRYCGVMLHIWNPKGGWWGEGDEKFFVDGEKFPSTFGTGSEDYFGYAWGNTQTFGAPYHCQPINENNAGHISNGRWHIMDNVPFQKSFEAAIEKYFPNDRPTLYDCVAYWYIDANGIDPYEPVTVLQVKLPVAADEFLNYNGILVEDTIFIDKTKLELISKTKKADIHYSLDGTEPTVDSPEYTEPIEIAEDTTVKVRAFRKDYLPSMVSSINFYKGEFAEPADVQGLVNGVNYGVYMDHWNKIPDFEKFQPIESGVADVIDHSPAIGKDYIALKFTGFIDIPATGVYTFYTVADDASALYIGDKQAIDNDQCGIEKPGQVALKAGKHPITVTFVEYGSGENLQVSYKGPRISKQQIPAKVLFRKK